MWPIPQFHSNRMSLHSWTRVRGYYRRNVARALFRKPLLIRPQQPLISFTFDDFPRTALLAGGSILRSYGASGTYYVCLGLLGKDSPCGRVCILDDLNVLLEHGHELGCHTFSHCHSWDTSVEIFEESIIQNRTALSRLIPGAAFRSFSYPISEPHPMAKQRASHCFQCCRSGGQTLNTGMTDLNQLSAYFLERSRDRIQDVKRLIDLNRESRGWIIFATHDVTSDPSPYGCSPGFFAEVVQYAARSGARILPVVNALAAIGSAPPVQ